MDIFSPLMPFTRSSLRFFRQLSSNNNKQWFEAHRDDYEEHVREPMRELVEDMFARFRAFAPEIGGDPKRSMFRINRDIRFSKNKAPYKTHATCWFHHRGAARALPKRFGGVHEYSTLKRMPRGYDETHPAAKWLKLQSFTSGRALTDADVTSARLGSLLAREYAALLPLVRWINGTFGLSE